MMKREKVKAAVDVDSVTAQVILMVCWLSMQEDNTAYTIKCNIDNDTNHVTEGIKLGLKDDREKNSEKLGRLAVYNGSSSITKLPPYITVQMVRFFYKVQAAQKAKILRKVCS